MPIVVGVIFGIIAIVGVKKGKYAGLGISIAVLVVSLVGGAVVLGSQALYSSAIDSASKSLDKITGDATDELLGNEVNVEFGDFTVSKDSSGITKTSLPVTVTNLADISKSYNIQVEALDASGSRITTDYVYASKLGAGQSQKLDAFTLVTSDNIHMVELNASCTVLKTLKQSSYETTELVLMNGCHKIRKTFALEGGLGNSYKELFSEQQKGVAFKHVPHIEACFESEQGLVVIMQYVAGYTLEDILKRNRLSQSYITGYACAVLDAVCELHENTNPTIVHRDLKPSNIMLAHEACYLIDFGISRTYKRENERDTVYYEILLCCEVHYLRGGIYCWSRFLCC